SGSADARRSLTPPTHAPEGEATDEHRALQGRAPHRRRRQARGHHLRRGDRRRRPEARRQGSGGADPAEDRRGPGALRQQQVEDRVGERVGLGHRHYDGMNAAWDAWLDKANAPARATVEARLATPDYLVEIAVIAGA